MLVELAVENLAVVERARIRFHPGLNLLTGETGSGKSIVVDALGLLFGGRASSDMVRSSAERARVSGIFEPPEAPGLAALLEEAGIGLEDGELLLEREILANGKSRAFAANRPVTAAFLRDVAAYLGDIHGQNDQQRLFDPSEQLAMLDAFAELGPAVAEVGRFFSAWHECSRELEELDRTEQENLRLRDLWSFQKKEIEAAALKAGEDAELENERRVLKNVARLQENANAAYGALYDAPESVSAQIRIAIRRIEELARIDESLAPALETLRPAAIAIEDASATLRDYLDGLEADPLRLEQVESRLDSIDRLKRKYGGNVEEILAFLRDVCARLDAVENAGERRVRLERERERLAGEYAAAAAELTRARTEAGEKLGARIAGELRSLAMAGTVFRVEIGNAPWSSRGSDAVRFLVSPNAGEEPKPLEKIASGGELSRIALAVKTPLGMHSRARIPRTLVFDEVDAGIGGAVAESVGRRLKKLAASDQVLCVTHLAQVASFADHHYVVEKRQIKGRTMAEIDELPPERRAKEIGRMLSGQEVTAEALKHAERLLQASR